MTEPGQGISCSDSPSEELLTAVDQFNQGEWFECHETLEELWVGSAGEMRDFYQGLLQVAVALHHWREGNFRGAILLLEKGPGLLRRVRPICQRIEVEETIADAALLREALIALGPERMAEVPPLLIPTLRLA